MKSILDKGFKYVPAAKTDIRKLFRKIIAERKEQAAKSNVSQIQRKVAKLATPRRTRLTCATPRDSLVSPDTG